MVARSGARTAASALRREVTALLRRHAAEADAVDDGGIAARSHGDAVVLLDERIAVGDPECRVTVLLGPAARNNPGGHHYRHGS